MARLHGSNVKRTRFMTDTLEIVDKKTATKVLSNAKSANKPVDDFYFIKGDKNIIKNLANNSQREFGLYAGNKKINILLWKS